MQRQPRVLIVADDLTGAMDTAGPFAQRGLATSVVAAPLACELNTVSAARVVSINTESRHLDTDEAALRVEACASRLVRAQRFDIVFKKIDSTLRGNVVAETLVLMRVCGRRRALVAPAFPAQGRTVRKGMVHVNGVALHDTDFARDALSPPPLAPLPKLFGASVSDMRVSSWAPGEHLSLDDDSIVIADSQTDADLANAVALARDRLGDVLLVGSAGLGVALAGMLGTSAQAPAMEFPVDGPILFVVGSRAAQSRDQVEALRTLHGTVVLEAPNGVVTNTPDLHSAAQVVIVAVADVAAGEADAREVACDLARAALNISCRIGNRALIATGGDTAIAVLQASGCAALEVLGDLMPGIPCARLTLEERSLLLVTKAGGFGKRDTLAQIAKRLRQAS